VENCLFLPEHHASKIARLFRLLVQDSDDVTPSILTPKMNPKRKQARRFSGSNLEKYPHATLPVARSRGKTPTGKATMCNRSTDDQTRDHAHHQAHLSLLHPARYKERETMRSSNSCPICPDRGPGGPTR